MTDSPAAKLPEHEATYRRLRDMAMFGELAPGQKVTLQGITASLGAGMTPVREAIRRLTAEGALILHENRRVSVPRLAPGQVDELAFARLALEPRLAELAMAQTTVADIDRLEALDQSIDAAIGAGDMRGYLAGNYRFHFALYDLARAAILLSLTQSLWLRFGPSLRVVMTTGGGLGPDLHKAALTALRAGDSAALAGAIADDIRQGVERVRTEMQAPGH